MGCHVDAKWLVIIKLYLSILNQSYINATAKYNRSFHFEATCTEQRKGCDKLSKGNGQETLSKLLLVSDDYCFSI